MKKKLDPTAWRVYYGFMNWNEHQECERCGGEAQTLMEHAQFGEAVCYACRDSELAHVHETPKSVTPWCEWVYENMRQEKGE